VPGYPAELERIVLRALRPDADKRQQTAQEFHDELERFIVSTGEPVSTVAMAGMMKEVFSDHIQNKKSIQALRYDDSETVPTVELTSDLSLQMRTIPPELRPRRMGAVLVVVVLGLLALGGGAALVLNARPDPAGASAVPDAAGGAAVRPDVARPDTVRLITIAASASPEGATLRLGDKEMENPFEIRRPAGEGTLELVVTAPGHEEQRFAVPLSRGGSWTVGLRPEAKTGPGKKKRRRKRHYLDNPYD